MPKRTSDGRVPSSARVDEPAVADEHRYEDGGSALQERSLRTQPQEDVGCPRSCLGTAAEPRLQVVELGLRPPAAAALRFRRRRLVEPARFELRLLHAAQSSAKSLSLRVAESGCAAKSPEARDQMGRCRGAARTRSRTCAATESTSAVPTTSATPPRARIRSIVRRSPAAARRAPQGGTARLDYAVKTGFPPVCGATAARTKL